MYDPVHHHVGAGPRLRQCLEQGGKALLRIHADWNLGPGALEQTRLRAVSLSVEQIGRALEGGRANVECKKPARGPRCHRIMFMGTARRSAVYGNRGSVRVDLGGRGIMKKKKTKKQ